VMTDLHSEALSQEIVAKAKAFGADLAGIARVNDLKRSPSHRISEEMPEFNGVGTKFVEGRKRGIVQWPEGARSAIVVAIEHPREKPELDWWISGTSAGNTAGNKRLMAVIKKLSDWLKREKGIFSFELPYHIEHGAIYMKDAAVLAGLGCIGKNNILVTPRFGPRLRLRVMLIDTDLPATGPIDFDPCARCPMPCRQACPQQAFAGEVYTKKEYGLDALPGRSGVFSRFECNRQMDIDCARFESVAIKGQQVPGKRIQYCRECELACPVGKN
jgi:epoxyqueuosine reductase